MKKVIKVFLFFFSLFILISNIPQASGDTSSVSGSVVTNNCLISIGDYRCYTNSLFTWSGVGTFAVANARNGVYYEGISGASPQFKNIRINYGNNSVSLLGSVDGGSFNTISGPAYVYAGCMPGLGWDGGLCVPSTGTIFVSNCTISLGSSSCGTTVNWSTNDADYERVITSNYPSANSRVYPDLPAPFTGNRSGSVSRDLPYGSNTSFYIYTNGIQIASYTPTASCAAGTVWNGTYCALSTPTDVEVYANNVRPKYTTTSGSNIMLKWEANGFPDITRVTCKLEFIENDSVVTAKTVRGLPYRKNIYPETGYLNPTVNTKYQVTCSDEVETSLTATDCTIITAGGTSCRSNISWNVNDPYSVHLGGNWGVNRPIEGPLVDQYYPATGTIKIGKSGSFEENTYLISSNSYINEYFIYNIPWKQKFVDANPVAQCDPATLYHMPGEEHCWTWKQYDDYYACSLNCGGNYDLCIHNCKPSYQPL